MVGHRWRDILQEFALQGASRRDVAVALAGLLPLFAVSHTTHARGNPRNRRRRRRRNRARTCGREACESSFTSEEDIDFCQAKCGRCRIRARFCIIESNPANPALIATCCLPEQTCCGDECADLRESVSHCGQCNRACRFGESCLDGQCVSSCGPGSSPCPDSLAGCCRAGRRCCAGVGCVDTARNSAHCGTCGNACAAQQVCQDGSCACGAGRQFCDGACVNVTTDTRHCGGCGNPCFTDQHCVNGECACRQAGWVESQLCGGCIPPDYTCCSANGQSCPNTHTCRQLSPTEWGCDAS